MANQRQDLELIQAVLTGEEAAFEELLERYSSRVMNLAMRVTRNTEDAEEVLQDVFITMFKKLSSFESRSAFSSWVYRVTMNAAFMKIRARNRRRTVSIEEIDSELKNSWTSNRSDSADIEYISTRHEIRSILQAAIDRLPFEYRAIFILRDIDGLSNQSTSDVLGISVPAVKSRLHRARVILREELNEYWKNGELVKNEQQPIVIM